MKKESAGERHPNMDELLDMLMNIQLVMRFMGERQAREIDLVKDDNEQGGVEAGDGCGAGP